MKSKNLRLFSNAVGGAKYKNIAKFGSSLIVNFINKNPESLRCYDNYLEALNKAMQYLNTGDFRQAEIKANEALASLLDADIVPVLTAAETLQLTKLTNTIKNNLAQSKC